MRKNIFFVSVLFLSLLLVASCKKKDDAVLVNFNTITMNIDSSIDITYRDIDSAVANYYISGNLQVDPNSMVIAAANGMHPDMLMILDDCIVGSYVVASDTATFSCSDATGQVYAALSALGHTGGTVNITVAGAVGERIQGAFSFVADKYNGANPSGSTVTISGTFDCIRSADIP